MTEPIAPDLARLLEHASGRRHPSSQLATLAADELALHPLSLPARRSIPLHPSAGPAADRGAPGERCGGCTRRGNVVDDAGERHPKCALPGRSDHTRSTDVLAWWPACSDFDARAGGAHR